MDDAGVDAEGAQGVDQFLGVGRLLSADIGAEVTFTTVLGETFRYVIVNRETLRPGETERLVTADNWQLTLFTCFLGGTTRCVLRCEEIPSDNKT